MKPKCNKPDCPAHRDGRCTVQQLSPAVQCSHEIHDPIPARNDFAGDVPLVDCKPLWVSDYERRRQIELLWILGGLGIGIAAVCSLIYIAMALGRATP